MRCSSLSDFSHIKKSTHSKPLSLLSEDIEIGDGDEFEYSVWCKTVRKVLSEKGNVVNVREVIAVCVGDKPGGMAEVMKVVDAAGTNVEYSYAFAFHRGEKAVLVFRFADNAKAEEALAQAGLVTLGEDAVSKEIK